MQIMPENKKKK